MDMLTTTILKDHLETNTTFHIFSRSLNGQISDASSRTRPRIISNHWLGLLSWAFLLRHPSCWTTSWPTGIGSPDSYFDLRASCLGRIFRSRTPPGDDLTAAEHQHRVPRSLSLSSTSPLAALATGACTPDWCSIVSFWTLLLSFVRCYLYMHFRRTVLRLVQFRVISDCSALVLALFCLALPTVSGTGILSCECLLFLSLT